MLRAQNWNYVGFATFWKQDLIVPKLHRREETKTLWVQGSHKIFLGLITVQELVGQYCTRKAPELKIALRLSKRFRNAGNTFWKSELLLRGERIRSAVGNVWIYSSTRKKHRAKYKLEGFWCFYLCCLDESYFSASTVSFYMDIN